MHFVDEDYGFVFVSRNDGFAYNRSENIVVKTSDGGERWSFIPSLQEEGRYASSFQKILLPTKSTIGYALYSNSTIRKTEDGGIRGHQFRNLCTPLKTPPFRVMR